MKTRRSPISKAEVQEIASAYMEEELTALQLHKRFNRPLPAIYRALKRAGVTIRTARNSLLGKKFGNLLVLELLQWEPKFSGKWLCECACGTRRECRGENLKALKVFDCGRKECEFPSEEVARLRAAKQKRAVRPPSPVLAGQIIKPFWDKILHNAEVRDIEVTVTPEEAWDVAVEQGLRCAYTNTPLVFPKRCSEMSKRGYNASLDRIDSTKGYVPGNVQWIHKDLQRMKSNYGEEKFLSWCAKIVVHKVLDLAPKEEIGSVTAA